MKDKALQSALDACSTGYRSERHFALDTQPVTYFGCNGNCNQGRMCDCVEDVPVEETPLGWRVADMVAAILLIGMCGALLFGL